MIERMIQLENVSKVYRKAGGVEVHALRPANLSIKPGEFVAIMGPSGSGKSTLMNILGLLDRGDQGIYHLAGQEVDSLSADELAGIRNERIGFVFQTFHLLPRTTAVENVELPLMYSKSGDTRTKALAALERVGLADRADHFASELSGGEQQRVAIARALVNDPDLLLADEPTGNLDSVSGKEILDIFEELHQQGKTIVLITHEESIAARAQRILRIVDGRIESDVSSGSEPQTFSKESQV